MRREALAVIEQLRAGAGPITEPRGLASGVLRRAIYDRAGLDIPSATMSDVLHDLERTGWICRRIAGRRTFEIGLSDPKGLTADLPPLDAPRRATSRVKGPPPRTAPFRPSPGAFYIADGQVVSASWVERHPGCQITGGPYGSSIEARTGLRERGGPEPALRSVPVVDDGDDGLIGAIESLRAADRRLVADLVERLRAG